MGKQKRNNTLPVLPTSEPDKVDTYAGKQTARITKSYKQEDGSVIKATRKINKDGSISDKIEYRHS